MAFKEGENIESKIILGLAAIIGIIVLEAYALYLGVNGAVLGVVIAALSGLGGYELKNLITKKKG